MNQHLFLGLDGGQTSTACVILNDVGDVLGTGYSGSVVNLMHPENAQAHMNQALETAILQSIDRAGIPLNAISSAYLSLTGGLGLAEQSLKTLLPRAETLVEPDIINALYCGRFGKPGVALICGTGAIAYLQAHGQRGITGGWGYLFGDEGSGQWIAFELLRACAKMSDGVLPSTPLLAQVLELFKVSSLRDVVGGIYNGTLAREALAPLTPLGTQAATDGDPIALEIFERAARALQDLLLAVTKESTLEHEDRVVIASGGTIKPGGLLWRLLSEKLGQTLAQYQLVAPILPPVLAAGLRAMEFAGHQITLGLIARLKAQAKEHGNKHFQEVPSCHLP